MQSAIKTNTSREIFWKEANYTAKFFQIESVRTFLK